MESKFYNSMKCEEFKFWQSNLLKNKLSKLGEPLYTVSFDYKEYFDYSFAPFFMSMFFSIGIFILICSAIFFRMVDNVFIEKIFFVVIWGIMIFGSGVNIYYFCGMFTRYAKIYFYNDFFYLVPNKYSLRFLVQYSEIENIEKVDGEIKIILKNKILREKIGRYVKRNNILKIPEIQLSDEILYFIKDKIDSYKGVKDIELERSIQENKTQFPIVIKRKFDASIDLGEIWGIVGIVLLLGCGSFIIGQPKGTILLVVLAVIVFIIGWIVESYVVNNTTIILAKQKINIMQPFAHKHISYSGIEVVELIEIGSEKYDDFGNIYLKIIDQDFGVVLKGIENVTEKYKIIQDCIKMN